MMAFKDQITPYLKVIKEEFSLNKLDEHDSLKDYEEGEIILVGSSIYRANLTHTAAPFDDVVNFALLGSAAVANNELITQVDTDLVFGV